MMVMRAAPERGAPRRGPRTGPAQDRGARRRVAASADGRGYSASWGFQPRLMLDAIIA